MTENQTTNTSRHEQHVDPGAILAGAEDYVVVRMSAEFPAYETHSDVDLLCGDPLKILGHILRRAKTYEDRGFKVEVSATGWQLHVDFFPPKANRLDFRFDLIGGFESFNKVSIAPDYVTAILNRKRKVTRDGRTFLIPDEADDLALRLLEYAENIDSRPDKVKHLKFVQSASNLGYVDRLRTFTNLEVTRSGETISCSIKPIRAESVKPDSRGANDYYQLSKTCQVPDLAVCYESLFGRRSNGRFVEVGAFDGEYVSNTSGLADQGWTGHYIEPVPQSAEKYRVRHANNPHVTVSNCAIGARRERIQMHVGGPLSTAIAAMRNHFETLSWAKGTFQNGETVEAEQFTLNEYLTAEKIEPGFDLMVIDIEGGEWAALEPFDIAHWQPQMVIIELHDQNQDYTVIHDQCAKLVRYFEQRDYLPIFKDSTNTVYVRRKKLMTRCERMDYLMVWGHGLAHTDEIMNMIRIRRELEIIAVHKKQIEDMPQFVEDLYACDTVPYEHLQEKTKYLLTIPQDALFILVRNHNAQEKMYGDGEFRHIQCALIKDVKEEVRNAFNPRLNGKRTEDHVIHGSDYESHVVHALQVFGLPTMEHYLRQPNSRFNLPYHLEPFEACQVIDVPLKQLRARILGRGSVPIDQTPHFDYVTGDSASYINYHHQHLGVALTDDHFPAAFDRLINEFDFNFDVGSAKPGHPVVRRDTDGNFVLQDGVHRAAILCAGAVPSVRVIEILPALQPLPLAAVIFSKDRAMQLDATLRSLHLHCPDATSAKLGVLYTTSSEQHAAHYEVLKSVHPGVNFVRERDFRDDLLKLLGSAAHVLFAVDDCLFVHNFRMSEVLEQLGRNPAALGFSLRLGRNTNYCYSFDHAQRSPEFQTINNSVLKFRWSGAEYDFGYPLEVSSSVYRTADLLPLLTEQSFRSPNTLEAMLSENAGQFASTHPELLSFSQSAAFCAPLNMVQSECPNRAGEAGENSPDELAQRFANGDRIDLAFTFGFTPGACHQEVPLQFTSDRVTQVQPLLSKKTHSYGSIGHRLMRRTIPVSRKRKWQSAIPDEVAFWNQYISTRGGGRWEKELEFRLRPDTDLQSYVTQGVEIPSGGTLRLLDVGAGPISFLGKRWAGRTVELTAVDPLAEHYHEILDRCGVKPPVPTELAAGETLTSRFALNHFDVVHARNCIDHSLDAPQAVDQMLGITKPGGWVMLEHGICESNANNQSGLHGWNFFAENNDFIIEAAGGERVNVTRRYAGVAEVTCVVDAKRNWISVRMQKRVSTLAADNRPVVSVVVPCYNQAEYLPDAVESVAKQTFRDFEIVIVDDGSPDNTVEVARQLAARHSDCHISIVNKPNGGLADARNAGIRAARGQYILPLDCDDKISTDHLAKTVAFLEANPKVAIVGTFRQDFGAATGVVQAVHYNLAEILQGNRNSYCSLYRRDVWEAVGGYRTDMVPAGYEDWDFWIGCAERGWFASILPEPLFHYRVKAESMFTEAAEHDDELRAQIALNHPKLFTADQLADANRCLAGMKTSLDGTSTPVADKSERAKTASPNDPLDALEKMIKEALSINPDGIEALQLLAALHIQRKDWHAGAQAGQRLFKLDPDGVKSLMLLAQCLLGGGDGETAIMIFQRVLAIEPQNELAGACLADLTEPDAEPSNTEEAFGQAERNVRRVLSLEPDNVDAHRLLTGILAGQSRWAEAIESGNRVLAAETNDVDTRALVAKCHWETGARTTAELLFEEVLETDPTNTIACEWQAGLNDSEAGVPVATPARTAELPKPGKRFPESKLAHQYLDGLEGLEIGGSAHNPFGLNSRNVDYTADLATVHKLEEVKICGEALPVDIVAPGDVLPVAEGSQDFVISSHVIEHFFDPIKAIKEWQRVVRPGGYVFIIAPHKERTFDKERSRTPLAELLDRHNGIISPPAVDTHHHYTVWTPEDLLEVCRHFDWNVVEFHDADDKVGNGFTLVIQKAPKPAEQAFKVNPVDDVPRENATSGKDHSRSIGVPDELPKVSVIVPTFNRLDRLPVALKSILAQTFRDFEIVVVNDAGEDVTDVVSALQHDGRIRVITHPENKGLAAARNTGIQAARGKYIAYLDDDDRFYPDHLQTLTGFLRDHPGTVAYTDSNRAHEKKINGQWQVTRRDVAYAQDWDNDKILIDNFVPVLSFMHEKSLLEKSGEFDETLRRHEDWDLWIRLSRHFDFVRIPRVTSEFSWRDDGTSMTGQSQSLFLETMRRIHTKYAEFAGGRPYLLEAQELAREELTRTSDAEPKFKVGFMTLDPKVTACAYLRLTAPLDHLHRRGQIEHLSVCDFVEDQLTTNDENLRKVQVLVVQRGMAAGIPYDVMRKAFPPSVRIVFELDDALTLLPPNHGAFDYFQSVRPQLEEYLRKADLVTVSTPKLKELYSGFNDHIEVLPNAIDTQIWKPQAPRPVDGEKIRILFSGTLTHQHDLALVEQAIERIALEFSERVEFLFWGNIPNNLRHLPQIKSIAEFTNDYRTYAQRLQAMPIDLALVPLEETTFNRAKSAIKWLEYSACRIPAIFTDIDAYNQTVEHGISGWLVPNSSDAWYGAMKRLVLDDSLRLRIGETAHKTVMREHTLKQLAPLWVKSYEKALRRSVRKAVKKTLPVSIVIPTFNNLHLTRRCLDSVLCNTPQGQFELVVVDNGSTDGTVPFLSEMQKHGRLRLISNLKNHGFAHACNQGAAAGQGDHVLFLNNDTVVTTGWIGALLETANRHDVGAVGAKLLYPDGTIQHAGIGWINGVPDHPMRHQPANHPEANQFRELDMVTGACLLVPRKLFVQLGGFDEIYRNGVEDIDLCLRIRVAGHKVVYQPGAVVFHHEGKSSGRFDHVSENLQKFAERWKGRFDNDYRFLLPKKGQTMRAKISVLNPAAGKRDSAASDHKVKINWCGSFFDYGSLSNINRVLTDALEEQGTNVSRVQTHDLDAKPPKALRVYRRKLAAEANADAALTVRHAWPPDWSRPVNGKLAVIQPWEFGSLPKQWVEDAKKVDAFWVPSSYVKKVYVESGVPEDKVHVVPNGIDPELFRPDARPIKLKTKKTFKFLFVGGTIHRKGPDVLLRSYCETFGAKDDVCLVIKDFGGGSVYAGQTLEQQIEQLKKQPNAPEILYLNEELPPADLPGLFTACDCLVHPYRGEGFGMPVLEAMACGLPVVVTAGGSTDDFVPVEAGYHIPSVRKVFGQAVGDIPLAGDGWLLEPNLDALKWVMRRVFSNRDEAAEKGGAASRFAHENYSWKLVAQRVAQLAAELIGTERKPAANATAKPVAKTVQRKAPVAIELPDVARLGYVGAARQLLKQKKLVPAWNAVQDALKVRPFHPEAYLLMAEIAWTAGQSKLMKECVDRVLAMTPNWKPAKKFIKSHPVRTASAKVTFAPVPEEDNPRLTVCLITKNEEQFIGQCLDSVKSVADQIVVMDTGSSDRTVEIAKGRGAGIHHFEWCDDFSAARNAALEHATGDWVLVLDADEVLSPDSISELKKSLKTKNAIGWRLPIIDDGREAEGCNYVARLFRNAPGLFYVCRVHEQVFSSVEVRREEWGMTADVGQATLRHYGYTEQLVKDRNKVSRNLKLLEKAIEEISDDPNLLMNYGLELVRSERLEDGLARYAEAFESMSGKPKNEVTPELRETLLTQYSSQLMKAKNWHEIVCVLNSGIARSGGLTASLHFSLGLAHQELHEWTEAAEEFRQCLKKRHQKTFSVSNKVIAGGAPRHCLALALWKSGDCESAAREFAAGLTEDPSLLSLQMDHARFLLDQEQPIEALQQLHGLVVANAGIQEAWVMGGRIALSDPDFIEFARDWTVEAVRQHPQNHVVVAQRAETLMVSQQFFDALPFWRQLDGHPKAVSARIICELMQGGSSIDAPPVNEREVSQEFLNWYRRLISYNAVESVSAIHERLETLRIFLPTAVATLEAVLRQAEVEVA